MKSNIRVSGNIIGELSEKIPTNIIALNELIKNSYDAGASFASIEINTSTKILSIKDDGCGMDKNDIDTLFHISKSTKIHGSKNEYDRITQGSKGLGFLSVFKFGKIVKWKTFKDKGYNFSINFDQLTSADDISKFEIELLEDDSVSKGTEIIIEVDDYNISLFNEYFSSEKNYKKIIHSFDDKKFIITLAIDGNTYSSENLTSLLSNQKDSQLFHISYNSTTQKIIFKHNNKIALSEIYEFPINTVNLDIELLTFQLKSHGKESIDKLFFNPIDDLTPLVYFNTNLFNNFNIFDPNIMRNIKTSQVLNQMIGYIRIISENSLIDFNSDRSQFLQNELTDSIISFLYNINKKIQEIGSENKYHLVGFDILKEKSVLSTYNKKKNIEKYRELIKDNFTFKKKVNINISKDKVIYSLFGKTATLVIKRNNSTKDADQDKEVEPAKIVLKFKDELEIDIPSGQIDLKKYLISIIDSKGNTVNNDKIVIKVDNKKKKNGILNSINKPCQLMAVYSFKDAQTGLVIEQLKLSFIKPISYITTRKPTNLFTIPAYDDYEINYSQYLDKLIRQINKLPVNKYLEVISCSLRVLFELSIDAINKSKKYSLIFKGINDIDKKILKIVNYIKDNESYISEISNKTRIEYKSLKKMLSISDYERVIGKTHLGSHKATMYITEEDIRYIIKYLSIFIVLTNEMLNNKKII